MLAINEEAELIPLPFHGVLVEGRIQGHLIVVLRARAVEGFPRQPIVGGALGGRVPHHPGVKGFHHIDFAARRPRAIDGLVGVQHPKRRPHTLPARQPRAELDPAVAKLKLVLRVDAAGGEAPDVV